MKAVNRAKWMFVVVWASAFAAGCRSAQMAPTVNPTAIRSIKIGITKQQLINILGQPLRIRPWGDGAGLYDYAIPGWERSSPSLWIYLEKGFVRAVHAERYSMFADDYAVYEARDDRPTFESPDFESTFTHAR